MCTTSEFKRCVGPFYGFVLSALTCITMLQIPIPVLHCHRQFEDGVALSEHLQSHHIGEDSAAYYHWHLILPSDLMAQQSHELGESGGLLQTVGIASGLQRSAADSELSSGQSHFCVVTVDFVREPEPQTPHRYNSHSHPPPLLSQAFLCVMLC
jgi:hypothetical protein